MGTGRHTGFTIIEVMLVFGIIGLIASFMLLGMGTQLNRQRYQDATNSLLGYVQGQYNLVANVNNSRTAVDTNLADCNTSGEVAGTSSCTIIGRIIHAGAISGTDTETITSGWVVAKADVATIDGNSTAEEILQAAELAEVSTTEESYNVRWGTKLVKAANHAEPLAFSMLIVRMPTTGIISTYVNTGVDRGPDVIALGGNLAEDFKLCVDPVGLLGTVNEPVGVLIKQGASNSSGVQMLDQGKCV